MYTRSFIYAAKLLQISLMRKLHRCALIIFFPSMQDNLLIYRYLH
nr:MAG TPA: hypothetical protein [Caudoviricetes sp.]